MYFDIVSKKDIFIFRIIYVESTVSLVSKFSSKENTNTFTLDEFHISYTAVYELLLSKAKGTHIFLGQYTLFDSDKLLELLIDILSRKTKAQKISDSVLFEGDEDSEENLTGTARNNA